MKDWVRFTQLYSTCKKAIQVALKDLPLKYEGVLVTLESRIRGEGREVVLFVRTFDDDDVSDVFYKCDFLPIELILNVDAVA